MPTRPMLLTPRAVDRLRMEYEIRNAKTGMLAILANHYGDGWYYVTIPESGSPNVYLMRIRDHLAEVPQVVMPENPNPAQVLRELLEVHDGKVYNFMPRLERKTRRAVAMTHARRLVRQ